MIVWESPDKQGKFVARVVRIGDDGYHGEFQFARWDGTPYGLHGGEILERVPVGLAYGAIFGPDVADVEAWIRLADSFCAQYDPPVKS